MAPKSFFSFDLTPKEEDPYTPKFTAAFPEPSYTQAEQSLDATPFFGGSGLDSAMAAKSLPEASAALGGAYQGLSGQRTKLMSELSQEQDGTDWGSVAKQAVAALFPILGGYALSGNVGGAYGAQVGGALQQQIVKSDKEDQLKRDFQIKSQINDIDKRQAAIAGQKLGIDKSVYAANSRAPTPTPFQKGEDAFAQKKASEDAAARQAEERLLELGGPVAELYKQIGGAKNSLGTFDFNKLTPEQKQIITTYGDDFNAAIGGDITGLLKEVGGGDTKLASKEELLDTAKQLDEFRDALLVPSVKGGVDVVANSLRRMAESGESITRKDLLDKYGETRRTAAELNNQLGSDAKATLDKGTMEPFKAANEFLMMSDQVINRIDEATKGKSPAEVFTVQSLEELIPGTEAAQLKNWIDANQAIYLFGRGGKALTQVEKDTLGGVLSGKGNLSVGALRSAIIKIAGMQSANATTYADALGAVPQGQFQLDMLKKGFPRVFNAADNFNTIYGSPSNIGPEEKRSAVNELVTKARQYGGLEKIPPQLKSAFLKHLTDSGFQPEDMKTMSILVDKELNGGQ